MVWSGSLDHPADRYAFSELVQHLMMWSDLMVLSPDIEVRV